MKVRDGWILLTKHNTKESMFGNSPELEGLLMLLQHHDELQLKHGGLTGGTSDNDVEGSS